MKEIIEKAKAFAYEIHQGDESGHDWYHIERVHKNAVAIAQDYPQANLLIIELSALLHDIADVKMENHEQLSKRLLEFLQQLSISSEDKEAILQAIASVSYNGGNNTTPNTLEGKIVQDADRLDAIGAIGIARTFAYGGKKGQAIYDPSIQVRNTLTEESYRNEKSTSINHFYEKLLLLKDLLHTPKAQQLAEEKQYIMEQFLKHFFNEWNGTK